MRGILDNSFKQSRETAVSSIQPITNYLKPDSDYVPVTTYLAPDVVYNWNTSGRTLSYYEFLSQSIYKELHHRFKQGEEIFSLTFAMLDTIVYKEEIGLFGKLTTNSYWGTRGYNRLFSAVGNDSRSIFTIEGRLVGNGYSCVYSPRGAYTNSSILYMLVLKKEYIRYYNQCLILDKSPRPEIFKLLVKSNFDVVRSSTPNIRKNYRKYVKNHYLSLGVRIEEVDDIFNLLFDKFKITGNTPTELEKNKVQFFKDLTTFI